VRRHQVSDGIGPVEPSRVRINTQSRQLVEVGAALAEKIRFALVFCHLSVSNQ
jgi:hypothetical protein